MEGQSKKDQSFSQQRGKEKLTLLPNKNKRMNGTKRQEQYRGYINFP
jgi:hypothetical protein